MRICRLCVLPESFPGVRFDGDGICQHCSEPGTAQNTAAVRAKVRERFQALLADIRAFDAPYDILVAYSGGKDSSYTLRMLTEEFELRVLALTFDHGFLSPRARENIQVVTSTLGVDHLVFSPNAKSLFRVFRYALKADIFPRAALQRASALCNTCMNLVKSSTLRMAVEMGIPLIGYGWSPGQVPLRASLMRLNPSMVREMQSVWVHALQGVMGEALRPYLLSERHFRQFPSGECTFHHTNVYPLAFADYDEASVTAAIQALGWRAPTDTDANSTNCLLNGLANQVHLERYGYHPYALEIANLVRGGFMRRDVGLAKLLEPPDPEVLAHVKQCLGLD